MTYTATKDIVSSIAQLSILAANDPTAVPDHVRIQGDAKSHVEVAELASKESGDTIKIVGKPEDYERIKAELEVKYHGQGGQFEYLR